MTSSVKPEVHNVSQCHQRRKEPQNAAPGAKSAICDCLVDVVLPITVSFLKDFHEFWEVSGMGMVLDLCKECLFKQPLYIPPSSSIFAGCGCGVFTEV